jgi:hypothetical protein
VCVFSVEVEREEREHHKTVVYFYKDILLFLRRCFLHRGPPENTQHIYIAHIWDMGGHNNKSNNKIACEVFLGVAIYFTLALLVSHLPCCIHRCSTFIHFVTKKAEQVAPETDLL